ncbi:response regulator [Phytohabitans flavus]|uniref:response regulator n=1 Tax=Phytohabitans flavus TaxID=1076124 RepID=UPI003639A604
MDGLRLLWIDDSPAGNESMINRLMARGTQVRTATDGTDAIRLLPYFGANAVLSDVSRGGKEVGFDDLARLREAGYTGPAYFFTSHVTDELRAKAEAVGADGITASVGAAIDWLTAVHGRISPQGAFAGSGARRGSDGESQF